MARLESDDDSGQHWSLALSLAALGTVSIIAGFFLLGAFAHGAIYLIRDASNAGLATDNVRTFVRGLI